MYIDLTELRNREQYIICRQHDSLNLMIWNYRPSCQFDQAWDQYTRMARGLITDSKGLIIARPFLKFFNVGDSEELQIYNLPPEIPEIREKLDGSLAIMYYNGDTPCIATRGTFNSDQAIWATNWISRFKRKDFLEGYTYLYEIIYPGNRIVVDYGDRAELVLLAVINNEDGSELDIDKEGSRLGIETPAVINDNVYVLAEKIKTMSIDSEGFVLRYPNGLRVKMKGWEYVTLHKTISQLSTTAIWESVSREYDFTEMLSRLPEVYHSWVFNQKRLIENAYNDLVLSAEKIRQEITGLSSRKDKAIYINKNYPDKSWLMALILDNKDISQKIWRVVKPEHAKPVAEI